MTIRRRRSVNADVSKEIQLLSDPALSRNVAAINNFEQEKEKSVKSKVSMKTVSQGMMDVSLLTSNASQLRTALLNPKYEFYWALVSLILVSMALQITARVIMLWSDYLKDSAGVGNKRKQLQFVALIIMSFITIANALISVFNVTGHEH